MPHLSILTLRNFPETDLALTLSILYCGVRENRADHPAVYNIFVNLLPIVPMLIQYALIVIDVEIVKMTRIKCVGDLFI